MKDKIKKMEKIKDIFEAKEQFHKDRAKLPFEEKIKILVQLQQIAEDVSLFKKGKKPLLPVWKLK
jgi:hypothetical protein